MARPRNKVVSEANQDDLIIDVFCDIIASDASRDSKVKISGDDAVDMRMRMHKLEKITSLWYDLREAEGKYDD